MTGIFALPLFLRVQDRRVVVVGGGEVAARKAADVRRAGAKVSVVAPKVCGELARLAERRDVTWHERGFLPSDLDDAWLAFAATDDPSVQTDVARAATERRVWLVAVDDVARATAFSGAIVSRPPFVVAIFSSAEAPALTRLLREILEQALPDDSWVRAARALRARWRAEKTPMKSRFDELLRSFVERLKR